MALLDRHLHVGLAGSQPDFADQHIFHGQRVLALDRQRHRVAGGKLVQFDAPLPFRISGDRFALSRDADGDAFPRICPAPYRQQTVTLQT